MAEFTYDEVGATQYGSLPSGYHHLRVQTDVGHGERAFRAAAEAVLDWRMHRALGVGIETEAHRAVQGAEIVVSLGLVKAPCRVVWSERGFERAGFAYGTLPGHPESGEEAFLVDRTPDGTVRLTVSAFSRPASLRARLVGPLGPRMQRAYGARCGKALARLVEEELGAAR